MDGVVVRYKGKAGSLARKLSRKDSLFIPQTFTERAYGAAFSHRTDGPKATDTRSLLQAGGFPAPHK